MTAFVPCRGECISPWPGLPVHPTSLLLLVLACISCKPASPAAKEASAAPTTSIGPAKPRPHRELLALADFSKFPKMAGATRQSTSPVSAGFSLPKKDATVVPTSISAMEAFLTSQGWKPSPDGGDVQWSATGGVRFFEKNHARLQASAGISRGFPDGEDLNAGLFLIGDVDARSLPQLPGSRLEGGDFSSARFTSPSDLMSVRKFNKSTLPLLGWIEFRPHTPPGYEVPMEDLEKEQSFVQNGIILSYTLTTKGSSTEVFVRCEVMETHLPIPPKPDMLKLKDSPALMSCLTEMTPAQALAWCQEALGKEGWTATQVPAVEESTTRHEFNNPSKSKPLILECLPSGKDTIVRLRETSQ